MKIILLGYNGLIGSYILRELAKHLKKNNNFNLICVGRNIKNQPFKNKNIKYKEWNFLTFNKSKLYFLEKENIIINCVGKNYNFNKNLKKINVIFIKKLIKYIQYNKLSVRFIHCGSVSVYGAEKNYVNRIKTITENSQLVPDDTYSRSKLEAEIYIQNIFKTNKKKFSFTILRIANVFSDSKNPNSFKLINFLLKKGIWFRCSDYTNYHFIHAKDVALAVFLCILHFKKSRDKIYNVSDDFNQFELHKIYSKRHLLRLLKIPIPMKILNVIIKYMPLSKKMLNFLLTISSQITYDNSKIKKELNFYSKYSLGAKFLINR